MMASEQPEQDRPEDDGAGSGEDGGAAGQQPGAKKRLTVVGIGASAGGLAALQGFFEALTEAAASAGPAGSGLAFVVVTHMDPDRESLLPEILQKHTPMPVRQVHDMVGIEAGHVYVIPPARRIVITDTHLATEAFEEPRGQRTPIDYFFRSLARVHRDAEHPPVAVILSGSGTDGAVGVKAVKEEGGLLLVQHPDEAEYDSMPRAAIASGLADVVLPVAGLARKLIEYNSNGVHLPQTAEALTPEELETVYRILTQVQAHTGHDFSQYKRSTLLRRIRRRMQLGGYTTLDAYLGYLRHQADEAYALFNDLLIGVTNFFRDREAWEALAEEVIPRIFAGKEQGDTVRAWSIGCATGEEAYSLAILLMEYAATLDLAPAARPGIQVFASDLDDVALGKGREGLYPTAIEADVSAERLARFFLKEGDYYRVRRELRDVVLFSNHSVLRDPPFSRLDLVSCRNLLIYLNRDLQQNVFQIFHYALNPEAYLFLGSSESAEMVHQLFRTVDKSHRIYRARPGREEEAPVPTLPLTVHRRDRRPRLPTAPRERAPGPWEGVGSPAGLHLELLEAFAPPSILVDEAYHIVHLSESAGRYLQLPGGTMSTDLLKLVRPALQFELRTALFEAFEQEEPFVSRPVLMQLEGALRRVSVAIRPNPSTAAGDRSLGDEKSRTGERPLALVFFLEGPAVPEEVDEGPEAGVTTPGQVERDALLARLEGEVQRLRERLQSTTEEHESANEELKAANEELQSINEEYRSTTEELETSKEELQSVNEELHTVNAELKHKLEEVSQAHSDLENLMTATEIATLFLDRELRIQRYTPATTELFNIMPGDRGRPIGHLTNKLAYDALAEDAEQVLKTLVPVEREVRADPGGEDEGQWLLARLRPYRTVNDRIEGVILTFVDVTAMRETEQALERSRERYQLLVEETGEYAMFTMDEDGRIDTWNQGAQRIFGYPESDIVGSPGVVIFTPEDQAGDAFKAELARAREQGQTADERWYLRRDGSRFWGSGVVTALWEDGRLRGYAKVLRDNTARKQAEEALQQSEARYRRLAETLEERVHKRTAQVRQLASELVTSEQTVRQRISQTLHDDLQQLLYAAEIQLQVVKDTPEDRDEIDELENMLTSAIALTRQLTVELSPPLLQGEGLYEAMEWLASHMRAVYGLQVSLEAGDHADTATEERRILLFQLVRELLFNVVKHAGVQQAHVNLQEDAGGIRIVVSDRGRGFDVEQALAANDVGFGLHSVRERLRLFDGSTTIDSRPGEGTRVTLFLPQPPA